MPAKNEAGRCTQRELARLAGVTQQTVGRALLGRPDISVAMRDKILALAAKHGYRPDSAARAMRQGGSRQVGVLVANNPNNRLTHTLAYEFILGINEGLDRAGYVMSLIRITDVESDDEPLSRVFKESMLDGMIVTNLIPKQDTSRVEQLLPHCVWLDGNVWQPAGCLRRDELAAGRNVAEGLADGGRKKLVWFEMPPRENPHFSFAKRLEGVRAVARKRRLKLELVEIDDNYDALDDSKMLERLRDPKVGVAASSSYLAQKMAFACMRNGIVPGKDFGLACCDDSHTISWQWPQLSRVSFDRFAMGLASAEMMIRMISEPSSNMKSITIEGEWMRGETA